MTAAEDSLVDDNHLKILNYNRVLGGERMQTSIYGVKVTMPHHQPSHVYDVQSLRRLQGGCDLR